jgi:hypothetical protein
MCHQILMSQPRFNEKSINALQYFNIIRMRPSAEPHPLAITVGKKASAQQSLKQECVTVQTGLMQPTACQLLGSIHRDGFSVF